MRKVFMLLGIVVALAIPVAALAADLNTDKFTDLIDYGEKCKGRTVDGVTFNGAEYHFVNNRLGNPGVADGILTYTFDDGADQTKGPSVNLGPVQHFYVFSDGELTSASTNLGGKLVLSSVHCKKRS